MQDLLSYYVTRAFSTVDAPERADVDATGKMLNLAICTQTYLSGKQRVQL